MVRLVPVALFTTILAASTIARQPTPPARYNPADDIIYQILPIAWRDSNTRPFVTPPPTHLTGNPNEPATPDHSRDPHDYHFGDFRGLTDSLPYLHDLGITGIWLTPIYESNSYHGYQPIREDRVNPWFGSEDQFLEFVREAHKLEIKVYLDFVCHVVSQQSEWFRGAFRNPEHQCTSWFAFRDSANTTFEGSSFTGWNGDRVAFANWDLRNEGPRNLVISWAKHWLDPNGDGDTSDGIDGFRLDHVWAHCDNQPNGLGYNIDDFWPLWRAAIDHVKPDVYTFADPACSTRGSELLSVHDAVFCRAFEDEARWAVREGKAAGLYRCIGEMLKDKPFDRAFLASLGSHMIERVASAIGPDEFNPRDHEYMPQETLDDNLSRAKVAAAVLLLQPFPPVLYYGDEIGMAGRSFCGGTDAIYIPQREPFKWNAASKLGPPMTDYDSLNEALKGRRYSRDRDGRSVEEQKGVKGSLLETYRELIALRKNTPALRRGEYIPLENSDPHVWTFLKRTSTQTILVAINLGPDTLNVSVDLKNVTTTDSEKGDYAGVVTDLILEIPGRGWKVIEPDLVKRPGY
jgi:glycosidase